ncbi:MAG: hypothetical protein ACO20F_08715 [Robiginitalea sp.]
MTIIISFKLGVPYLITDSDGNFMDKGKYLRVWQKSEDGTWELTHDIWNSDVPLQTEVEEMEEE